MAESTHNEHRDFHCIHCEANIRIPRSLPSTTGPCPVCGGIITSPEPEEAESFVPEIPATPSVQSAPAPPVVQEEPPSVPSPSPEASASPPPDLPEKAPSSAKKRAPILTLLGIALFALLLLGGIVSIAYFVNKELKRKAAASTQNPTSPITDAAEANYIRSGWKSEAYELLQNFISSSSTKEKLPYILDADALAEKIETFYGGSEIFDNDTPADAFSVFELSEEDRRRGLFMMVYDQPPQFDMKEFFRPLAPLEVQHGLEPAGLLLASTARASNFALDPVRVHAFFKRTAEGLKLDWEIFAQTKYRTFQNFVELPEPGEAKIFRVFIVEDVPPKGRAIAGTRTYRLADPANVGDSTRVNVMIDSEPGRALSLINWRGTQENRPITRTATVELKWTDDSDQPELQISRFICWEFLGLGGQASPAPADEPGAGRHPHPLIDER